MKITVQAKPKSKQAFVRQLDATHFIVAVHDPPVDGKANRAIISALADYLRKPRSDIRITSGEISRTKIVDVPLSAKELENLVVQKKLF